MVILKKKYRTIRGSCTEKRKEENLYKWCSVLHEAPKNTPFNEIAKVLHSRTVQVEVRVVQCSLNNLIPTNENVWRLHSSKISHYELFSVAAMCKSSLKALFPKYTQVAVWSSKRDLFRC
uniref:Uncharacterized protein n=1 Tax=Parascaris equorum TaxID=6256 RepID=A0A914S611_PAREQ